MNLPAATSRVGRTLPPKGAAVAREEIPDDLIYPPLDVEALRGERKLVLPPDPSDSPEWTGSSESAGSLESGGSSESGASSESGGSSEASDGEFAGEAQGGS